MIRLTLPWPESNGNHQYTIVRNRKILSSKARKYKEEVALICARGAFPPLTGDLAVTLRLFRPRKVGDADGPIKQILDSMQGWLYADDKFITEIHVYRGDSKENPRVEVEITPL